MENIKGCVSYKDQCLYCEYAQTGCVTDLNSMPELCVRKIQIDKNMSALLSEVYCTDFKRKSLTWQDYKRYLQNKFSKFS